MKSIIVCNNVKPKGFSFQEKYIKAQIDNSLHWGWTPKDIIFAANFEYEYRGVKTVLCEFNCDYCLTGSKTFAMRSLFQQDLIHEECWLHDLDAWQLSPLRFPYIKDLGMVRYIGRWNGGSVFLKPEARDIIEDIAKDIEATQSRKEEPIIKRVFRKDAYKNRVTRLDQTYNVGATGFEKRYSICDKPVQVVHMHPHRVMDCNRNIAGMNRIGASLIPTRLLNIFKTYFESRYPYLNEVGEIAEISVRTNPHVRAEIAPLKEGEKFHTNRNFCFKSIT